MTAIALSPARGTFLRRALLVDAASCAAMGLALAILARALAPLLGLPEALVWTAGLALLPVAAYMALVGTREAAHPALVWVVIAGNAAWVAGSIAVLALFATTALGTTFVLAQAAAVAILAELEWVGLRRAAG
jgi:hypothetical protein